MSAIHTEFAQPLYFGPEQALFGHLHRGPSHAEARIGVVICNPFGAEAMSAHRALRHLAEGIAAQAAPCLRFDYRGCGDSADLHRTAVADSAVAPWLSSIDAAIEALKLQAGVEQVILIGLRLGALLACTVAAQRADVWGVLAWAPVTQGRAFLREYKMLGLCAGRFETATLQHADGSVEAAGFVLNAATCEALGAMKLTALARVPAPRMLLLDRDDFPVEQRWVEQLRESGMELAQVALPGYAGMMQVAHSSQLPQEMFAHALGWVRAQAHAAAQTLPAPAHQPAAPASAQAWWCEPAQPGTGLLERAVRFADAGLFGIVSAGSNSPRVPRGRVGVLLINTGAEHHVGPNRMYVPWARQWALQGMVVMRIALSGIGESGVRAGQTENQVYGEHAVNDLQAALQFMRDELGVLVVHAVGLCSGAYHAYKAAVAAPGLRSVTAINPLVFFWKPGMPLDDTSQAAVVHAVSAGVGRALLDPPRWMKLARGEVHVSFIVHAVSRRMGLALRKRYRSLARALHWTLRDDLSLELARASGNGVQLYFIFSERDPGRALLLDDGGKNLRDLQAQGHVRVAIMRQADHTFTQAAARQRLFDLVLKNLEL